MRNKIKMLKMCAIWCFVLVKFTFVLLTVKVSSSNLNLIPLSMTLNMISGCEIRLVVLHFFYETEIAFLRQ